MMKAASRGTGGSGCGSEREGTGRDIDGHHPAALHPAPENGGLARRPQIRRQDRQAYGGRSLFVP